MKIANWQAAQALLLLRELINYDLPVKTLLRIANLAQVVNQQVSASILVRDSLLRNYRLRVKVEDGAKPELDFLDEVSEEEKIKALTEFTEKLNEMMATEGDIDIELKIPGDLNIDPGILKPIQEFIEK